MADNNITAIKQYLSTPDKPLSTQEMMAFWKTLTEEEKQEYREADLS